MDTLQLVYLEWISEEREKHIWEDLYIRSWDEIIGRMYLLKANDVMGSSRYKAALPEFKRALALLAKQGASQWYYVRALNDTALVQCFLGRYKAALATIDQAIAVKVDFVQDAVLANRGAILVLLGKYTEALEMLSAQLKKKPQNSHYIRFTQATCLLHLERYEEAIAAYEEAIAGDRRLSHEGLEAARLGQQPDWDNL